VTAWLARSYIDRLAKVGNPYSLTHSMTGWLADKSTDWLKYQTPAHGTYETHWLADFKAALAG